MELIKKIITLITSFFQNSTAKKKEDISLAEVTETAVVETIRATQNSAVIQQKENVEIKLKALQTKQKEEAKKEEVKSVDEQFDEQFGQDQ